MRKTTGFSLVELLVAMAIMSMTLMISSLGYSFFMERWQKNLGNFDNSANVAKRLILIKQVISGMSPYVLKDDKNAAAIYFEGSEDSFIGVSTRALRKPDVPFVIRLSIKQQDDFSYNVIYESSSIEFFPVTEIRQQIIFDAPITLISGLQDVKFAYYGNTSRDSAVNGETKSWWQSFNSLNRKIMPEQLRIGFVKEGAQQQLIFSLAQADSLVLKLFEDDF